MTDLVNISSLSSLIRHLLAFLYVYIFSRKSKVLSKLQPSLVKFFFDCLLVSTPLKINFTKELVTPFFDGLIDFSVSNIKSLKMKTSKFVFHCFRVTF